MFTLKLHSTVELVLYAVRNEIIQVQHASFVPRNPQNGNGLVPVAIQGLN
jgi:hypothetical protein